MQTDRRIIPHTETTPNKMSSQLAMPDPSRTAPNISNSKKKPYNRARSQAKLPVSKKPRTHYTSAPRPLNLAEYIHREPSRHPHKNKTLSRRQVEQIGREFFVYAAAYVPAAKVVHAPQPSSFPGSSPPVAPPPPLPIHPLLLVSSHRIPARATRVEELEARKHVERPKELADAYIAPLHRLHARRTVQNLGRETHNSRLTHAGPREDTGATVRMCVSRFRVG